MHHHELLSFAQVAYQALCRALPAGRLPAVPGVVWTVGQHAVFQVTVWRKLLPGVLPQPEAHEPGAQPLLVTEYVEEAVGEQLREEGICYLDLAGNAWLQHPAASELYVLVQGRPRYRKPVRPGAAFRRDGLRVLFYGLTQPRVLAYPDKELAAHADLTPHILTQVLADLAAQGLLAHEPRRLVALPALAARWVAAYPVLRQRLNPRRYRWLDPAKAANWRELPLGSTGAWSGEAAAQLLLGETGAQPARLLLYSAEDRENLCARLGLKPHPHGTVELLRPFARAAPLLLGASCVHPLVVYADLQLAETASATQLALRLAQRYLPDLIAPLSA